MAETLLLGTVVADPDTVIEDGAVAIRGSTIEDVGEREEVTDRHPEARRREFGLVMPGLVSAHVHSIHAIARGADDDSPLFEWLAETILPMEATLTERETRVAARLGYLELLENGVTTCVDHLGHHHAGAAIEEAADLGLRGRFGKAILDDATHVPEGVVEDTTDALAASERLIEEYHGARDGRVRYAITPRFAPGCSDRCLRAIRSLADRHEGVGVHTHVCETRSEVAKSLRDKRARPVERLAEAGLLGRDVLLVHGVWTNREERARLAEADASIVHCPSANAKLGSGVAPVPEYLAGGLTVALGNDGPACNNSLDPFRELRLASLLHRADREDASLLSASTVLAMATLHGAKAAGFDRVGALRPGWRADVIGLDTAVTHATPLCDARSHLVYSARGDDVVFSMIDGEVIVEGGEVRGVDAAEVRRRARSVAEDLDTIGGKQ